MPTFYGILALADQETSVENMVESGIKATNADGKPHGRHTCIVLQNLTLGFLQPCVLDLKLGGQLWDEYAPQEKRDRLDKVSDATTSRSLGFRIAGMKVWKDKDYKVFDKNYGRKFSADNVIDGLKEFFNADVTEQQKKILVNRFAAKVTKIRKILEGQESRMYSASFLFVYEGDSKALGEALAEEHEKGPVVDNLVVPDDEEDEEEGQESVDERKRVEQLKLIDFAHANWTPGQGPDENALQGVRGIEKLLRQVLS